MKIVCVYIFPVNGADVHLPLAQRFMQTYDLNPPGAEHESVVICNNGSANLETKAIFANLPHLTLLERIGPGKDIAAYQLAADVIPADMMVFFGGNTYFRGPGWLTRMSEAFLQYGDTLYGATGDLGNKPGIWPHVRTTGMWCSPELIKAFPFKITDDSQRYSWEHGEDCLTSWVIKQGKTPWIVGWDGCYPIFSCNTSPGSYKGNQSNVLIGDRMTKLPSGMDP